MGVREGTRIQCLMDAKLKAQGGLRDFVTRRLNEGASAAELSTELETLTQVRVHPRTLYRWASGWTQ